jgi:hypothetical protein
VAELAPGHVALLLLDRHMRIAELEQQLMQRNMQVARLAAMVPTNAAAAAAVAAATPGDKRAAATGPSSGGGCITDTGVEDSSALTAAATVGGVKLERDDSCPSPTTVGPAVVEGGALAPSRAATAASSDELDAAAAQVALTARVAELERQLQAQRAACEQLTAANAMLLAQCNRLMIQQQQQQTAGMGGVLPALTPSVATLAQ